MKTLNVTSTINFNGSSYRKKSTETFDNILESSPTVAAAKTGTLTTRTDANTGTLTMASGHGITTGAKFDLFWYDTNGNFVGSQRNITAGTVSGTSVPFDLGTGDDLPVATTAIVAMVPVTEVFVAEGDDVKVVFAHSPKPAYLVFLDASDAVLFVIPLEEQADGSWVYLWYDGSGVDNPIAGDSVAKVLISHGNSAASVVPTIGVGYN